MKNIDYTAMGGRIRSARQAAGLSQSELAERCALSVSFLGHIERGSRKMSLETLVSICEVLNLSADYLLQDELEENEISKIKELEALWKDVSPSKQELAVPMIKAVLEHNEQ